MVSLGVFIFFALVVVFLFYFGVVSPSRKLNDDGGIFAAGLVAQSRPMSTMESEEADDLLAHLQAALLLLPSDASPTLLAQAAYSAADDWARGQIGVGE